MINKQIASSVRTQTFDWELTQNEKTKLPHQCTATVLVNTRNMIWSYICIPVHTDTFTELEKIDTGAI